MKQLPYATIPSVAQWRHDSSVAFAIRCNDIALLRIDQLLKEYHYAANQTRTDAINQCGLALCDMFLTLDYWFKMQTTRPGKFELGRVPAMQALFAVVVKELGPFFGLRYSTPASPREILEQIEKMFLAGMSADGINTDRNGMVEFDKKQPYRYRVWFKNGIAYQLPWWTKGECGGPLCRANSKHGFVNITRNARQGNAGQKEGFSGFIMTFDREIFMALQDLKLRHFHSSYNGGKPVAMAGTILIKNGVIEGVRTDSGHYKPGGHNLTAFLWALIMYQVNLHKIALYDYAGNHVGWADEHWRNGGRSLEQFSHGALQEHAKFAETHPSLPSGGGPGTPGYARSPNQLVGRPATSGYARSPNQLGGPQDTPGYTRAPI